jgi:hypothetical protein
VDHGHLPRGPRRRAASGPDVGANSSGRTIIPACRLLDQVHESHEEDSTKIHVGQPRHSR